MKISLVLAAASMLMASAAAAALTASTSLTVVNVTNFMSPGASAVLNYTQDWPVEQSEILPRGHQLFLKNVTFSSHNMSWSTTPAITPYGVFYNGLNSMVAAVWSKDGGKTFNFQSWDYLRPYTKGKHMEKGMPDCWMGTMIHTICDRKAGECNGRYRSNLYFTEYPTGNTACWGTFKK